MFRASWYRLYGFLGRRMRVWAWDLGFLGRVSNVAACGYPDLSTGGVDDKGVGRRVQGLGCRVWGVGFRGLGV